MASIVLVIDHSTSMYVGNPNLLSIAQTDASTFVTIMQIGDQLGVVGFGFNAEMAYPATQNLVSLDSLATKAAAAAAIRAISLSGNTNMGAAVTLADSLLTGVTGNRGAVLLSDGDWNSGANPLDVCSTTIPIYTIALNQISTGGQQTLNALASKTGGSYNYVPNYRQLAQIYYAIIGQARLAQVAYNQAQQIAPSAFQQVPLTIAGGTNSIVCAFNWGDSSCQFTSGTPVGNQVNITLQDPSGAIYSQPGEVGPGYCTFNVDNPMPGTWNFGTWCGQTNNFTSQAGAFERNSSIELVLAVVGAGGNGAVAISVTDQGEPVRVLSVRAKLVAPVNAPTRPLAADLTKLNIAENEDPPGPDHIPDIEHHERPLETTALDSGVHLAHYTPAVPGSHTVEVIVTGHAPRTGTSFSRTGRISLYH